MNNGRALVRAATELKPDVFVVDVAMPILNGLDAGQQVKETCPAVKLVFLTMNSDIELAAEAFRRGASGCLLKTCAASEMVTTVHEVPRPVLHVQDPRREDVNYLGEQKRNLWKRMSGLQKRQREVLQLLAEGKVMKEIADILNMTTRTVAFHKYRMMEALGAKSNAELVRYAVRHHIVAA